MFTIIEYLYSFKVTNEQVGKQSRFSRSILHIVILMHVILTLGGK